jgi:hypothetical protein
VPQPSAFEAEMASEKLKIYKSPSGDQIQAEMIQARGRTMHSEIHRHIIIFGIRKNFLKSGQSQSL